MSLRHATVMLRGLGALAALSCGAAAPALAAGALPLTVPVQFNGTDGGIPYTGIVLHGGAFYGTTDVGGGSTGCNKLGCGTVFRAIPPKTPTGAWSIETLYRFAGGTDGANPQAEPVFDAQGRIYGTTTGGGTGDGTLYRLTPPAAGQTAWQEEILFRFDSRVGGNAPLGAIVLDAQGGVIGTNEFGGNRSAGTVYRVAEAPDGKWHLTVLYEFGDESRAGNTPVTGLTPAQGGTFVGATSFGGTGGHGTVFRLVPDGAARRGWRLDVLHAFTGGDDGATPNAAPVVGPRGDIIGVTAQGGGTGCGGAGCGTVYRLAPQTGQAPAWQYSVLHQFGGGMEGGWANSRPGFGPGGSIVGATESGGGSGCGGFGCGTIYTLKPGAKAWSFQTLYRFTGGADGLSPNRITVAPGGPVIIGTAAAGANPGCAGFGCGDIFMLRMK